MSFSLCNSLSNNEIYFELKGLAVDDSCCLTFTFVEDSMLSSAEAVVSFGPLCRIHVVVSGKLFTPMSSVTVMPYSWECSLVESNGRVYD